VHVSSLKRTTDTSTATPKTEELVRSKEPPALQARNVVGRGDSEGELCCAIRSILIELVETRGRPSNGEAISQANDQEAATGRTERAPVVLSRLRWRFVACPGGMELQNS